MHVDSVVHQIEKHSKSWNFWGDRFFTNFSKITFSEKVTTDFENRTKLRPCLFFYIEHKAVPYSHTEQVQSVLQPQISILFAHFRFEHRQLKISITQYSWEKNIIPEKFIKSLYWWFKKNWKLWNYRTSRFVYTAARRNVLAFPHCMQ